MLFIIPKMIGKSGVMINREKIRTKEANPRIH